MSARTLQASANQVLNLLGEKVTLFRPSSQVSSDLNVLPSAYIPAGPSVAYLEMSQSAADTAQSLGVMAARAAFAWLRSDAEGKAVDRGILIDAKKRVWVIHENPAVTEMGTTTMCLRALISLQLQRPDGLPASF